jgi:hypothetical protein
MLCRWLVRGQDISSVYDFASKHDQYLVGNIRIVPIDMVICVDYIYVLSTACDNNMTMFYTWIFKWFKSV